MKKRTINAIHDDDLLTLFKDLGLLEKYKERQFKCVFCESQIGEDNLYSLRPKDNRLFFCCDKEVCIKNSEEI